MQALLRQWNMSFKILKNINLEILENLLSKEIVSWW